MQHRLVAKWFFLASLTRTLFFRGGRGDERKELLTNAISGKIYFRRIALPASRKKVLGL
jgi:hypothetical protein